MADERVILEVDMRDRAPSGRRDPVSRAFDRPDEVRQEARRERRQRILHGATFGILGSRGEVRDPQPQRATRATDVVADRNQLRRAGVFLGEGVAAAQARAPSSGGGGQRGGGFGGGGAGGGRRGGRGGARNPIQVGQIFQTGRGLSTLGIRAAGLATIGGTAGAFAVGALVLDQALTQLTRTVLFLNRQFSNTVDTLSDFSPTLARGRAEREVALLTNRVGLAQQLGPSLAAGQRAQTEFLVTFQTVAAQFSAAIGPLIEGINNISTSLLSAVDTQEEMRAFVLSIAKATDMQLKFTDFAGSLLRAWADERKVAAVTDDFLQDQINFFAQPTRTFRGERRAQGARER